VQPIAVNARESAADSQANYTFSVAFRACSSSRARNRNDNCQVSFSNLALDRESPFTASAKSGFFQLRTGKLLTRSIDRRVDRSANCPRNSKRKYELLLCYIYTN